MSAASTSAATLTAAHRRFEAALPAMNKVYRYQFRKWPEPRRADAIAEARAATWCAWHGLLRRGKDPTEVGPTGIATRCCQPVKRGRKTGNAARGRSCLDILDRRARKALGVKVLRLDRRGAAGPDAAPEGWRAWLAEDNRVGPADEACFRLDFQAWLGSLPARKRKIAMLLAASESTGEVARAMGVTPGAISQTRTWLEASWGAFQAPAAAL
jgi:hypothetical protein